MIAPASDCRTPQTAQCHRENNVRKTSIRTIEDRLKAVLQRKIAPVLVGVPALAGPARRRWRPASAGPAQPVLELESRLQPVRRSLFLSWSPGFSRSGTACS